MPVDSWTNRLTTATGVQTVTHDAAGNLTSWNGQSYNYDPFGMAWRVHTGAAESLHLYTADDERFWTYTSSGSRWTIRDLDGKVLREYSSGTAGWQVERDYVYRDGQLLAAVSPADGKTYHYHPDHLGTPRLITNQFGQTEAYHAYWPYGEEATSGTQDAERMKFTGHERDLGFTWTTSDDLDYHHARYYNFRLGRYSSPDPVMGEPKRPQTWNRYLYALANPLKWIDPTGEVVKLSGFSKVEIDEILAHLNEFTGNSYEVNEDLELQLVEVGAESSSTATRFLDEAIGASDTFTVKRTAGKNYANRETGEVFLNPLSFRGARYGAVPQATFNLGSTLTHELHHVFYKSADFQGPHQPPIGHTGPTVDFVNSIRQERGLPIRASYRVELGIRGRQKVPFKQVDPQRPERIHYVRRDPPN